MSQAMIQPHADQKEEYKWTEEIQPLKEKFKKEL
jgi:hypothetical protein